MSTATFAPAAGRARFGALIGLALTIFGSLVGPTRGQNDRIESAGQPPVRPQQQPQGPAKPADPNAIKATWKIAGEEKKISAGDFYAKQLAMNALEGTAQQGVSIERVWEHILMASEADGVGIVVTDEELDTMMQKDDPDLYEGFLKRWKQVGVSVEDGRAYMRNERKADRLRDLWLNTSRVTTKDAFDIWKQQHYRLKLEYIGFGADQYASEYPREKIDEATLKTFWNENKVIQAQFRTPNTVSAEFIGLDTAAYDLAKLPAEFRGKEVSRDAALEYYTKNRDALNAQIPADKQHLLVINAETPLEKVSSPFALLEETIRKALQVQEVINAAHKEAAADPKADLSAIAKKFGLDYQKFENVDRPQSMQQMARYGFNIFVTLNGAKEGEVAPTIADERGFRYFFRLNKRQNSTLPEFAEIREKILDKYIETQTLDKARRTSQELVSYVNDKINAEVQPLQERLIKEADADAEKRIAELGLSRDEDKARERNASRSRIRQALEDEKKKLRPKFFEEFIASKGLKTSTTDYFELQPMRIVDRSKITNADESRLVFFRTNYFVQNLQAGDITPVALEDPQGKAFYVAKLLDRAEPDIKGMSPADLYQATSQVRAQRESEFMQRFRFQLLTKRLSHNLLIR